MVVLLQSDHTLHGHKNTRLEAGEMDILSAIGNTPLIELTHLDGTPLVKIFAKLEACNPGDRSRIGPPTI